MVEVRQLGRWCIASHRRITTPPSLGPAVPQSTNLTESFATYRVLHKALSIPSYSPTSLDLSLPAASTPSRLPKTSTTTTRAFFPLDFPAFEHPRYC